MSIQVVTSLTLAAASANNIALSQTPTSGVALTLNGSTVTGGVATLDVPRRVLLTFGNEASNRTMVIAGTDRNGAVISETLTVVSGAGGTVATNQDYATVTAATPAGGGWTAAVTLGTNGTGSGPWVPWDVNRDTQFQVSLAGTVLAGAPTWQVDYTYDNVWNLPSGKTYPTAFVHPVLVGQTGQNDGAFNFAPVRASRLTLTAIGSAQLTQTQEGI